MNVDWSLVFNYSPKRMFGPVAGCLEQRVCGLHFQMLLIRGIDVSDLVPYVVEEVQVLKCFECMNTPSSFLFVCVFLVSKSKEK